MNKTEDLRKDNLRIDNFKTALVREIAASHLSVGIIYYVLKDTLNEIENLYTQQANQEYKEFCAAATQETLKSEKTNEESSSEAEEAAAANNNEEGAK